MNSQLSGPGVGAPTPEEIAAAEPVTPTQGIKLPQVLNLDSSRSLMTDTAAVPAGANYGSVHGFGAAFAVNGNDLTSGTYRATKYWLMRLNDEAKSRTNGVETTDNGLWVNKEEFDQNYSLDGAIKFDPHFNGMMSRKYAETLKQDKIDDAMNEAALRMSNAPVANTAGSLVRGLLDPVGLAAGYAVPELALAKWGMGATKASRAGTGAAAIVSRTANGAINGAASSLYVVPYQAFLDKQNQTNLMSTGTDIVNAVGMMTVLGAAGGFIHGVGHRVFNDLDRSLANAAMHESLTSKDPAALAELAKKDPRVAAALQERAKVRDALSKPADPSDRIMFMADDTPETMPFRDPWDPVKPDDSVFESPIGLHKKIDSTTHAPAVEPKELPFPRSRRVLEDILSDPTDKRIRDAVSDDERFLNEAWQTLWGVKLRFVDRDLGRRLGFAGFVKASEPNVAYIREGLVLNSKDAGVNSMMFVAGHELGHSIRRRDPQLWRSMVDSMMLTAKDEGGGSIGEAWNTVVRTNKASGIWQGLPHMEQKMDETFATILGQSMQHSSFWDKLHHQTPEGAVTLSRSLFGLRAKLGKLMERQVSPETSSLYDSLTKALAASGINEKTISHQDAENLAEMYKAHIPEFKRVMRMFSDIRNKAGKSLEMDEAKIASWIESRFPQVARVDDHTEKLSTIMRNRRIDSKNPGLWLLKVILQNADPLTDEFQTYTKWMHDEFSRTESGVVIPRNDPNSIRGALKDYPPLVAFTDKGNGYWDIGIFRNDDFKVSRWTEILDSIPSDTDMVSRAFVSEELDPVRKAFDKFVQEGTKTGVTNFDTGKARKIAERSSFEFSRYLDSLTNDQLHTLLNEDPTELFRGFNQHLENKAAQYRLEKSFQEVNNLSEIARQIDPLTKVIEGKSDGAPDPTEVHVAWNAFIKKYPAIKDKMSEFSLGQVANSEVQGPLSWGALAGPPYEVMKAEFEKARAEIVNELRETSVLNSLWTDGKKFEVSLAKAMFGPQKFNAELKKLIDEMAHARIRDSGKWPHYDQVMKVQKAAEWSSRDKITIQYMDPNADFLKDFPDFNEHFSDMGDGNGGIDFMAAPQHLTQAERLKQATERLKERHATYAPHLLSADTTRADTLQRGLERVGMDSFELIPTQKAAGASAPKPANLELNALFIGVKNSFDSDQRVLKDLASKKPITRKDGFAEEIVNQYDLAMRQHKDPILAYEQVHRDIVANAESRLIGLIQDHETFKQLTKVADAGPDSLYSYLDGSPRKGVKSPGMSVGESMPARIHEDLGPLMAELQSAGVSELWRTNDPVFMKSIISELSGVPTKDPKIKKIADVIRMTDEMQAGRLNSRGANIRYLKDRAFGAVHDKSSIGSAGDGFISEVAPMLDTQRMKELLGSNAPNDQFDPVLYLKQFQHEIASETTLPAFDANTQGGNIANKVGRRKTMFFKDPTYAFEYDMKYGSGNTAGLIFQQIVKRSEQATIMDHFGNQYKKNWNALMAKLGKNDVPSTYPDGLATLLAKKFDQMTSKLGRIDGTFQMLVGDLNHPEDFRLAQWGQAARNAVNSVAIWMSGISSMTDVGNIASAARFMGVDPKTLHSDLIKRIASMHKLSPEHQAFLQGQGAGMEAMINAFTRTNESTNRFHQFAQQGSDLAFWGSGQEKLTNMYQMAFHDIASQHLGELASSGKSNAQHDIWLKHYGITKEMWHEMSKHASTIEGLDGVRLAPDMIHDETLSRALRVAMSDTMHQAVLEPSVSTRAFLTGFTKAGTKTGEAIRTINQYKGYPLAMVSRVHRRFSNAYGDSSYSFNGKAINQGTLEKIAWASSMLSLSMTVLAIKDVLRFREPLNPLDTEQWTIGNVARIVGQAGVGPFAVFEQFLTPRQIAGPALGMAGGLAYDAATGNGYGVTNDLMGMVPGASIAPLREASKAVLGTVFADSYGVNYQMYLRRLEQEGQTSLFLAKNR